MGMAGMRDVSTGCTVVEQEKTTLRHSHCHMPSSCREVFILIQYSSSFNHIKMQHSTYKG